MSERFEERLRMHFCGVAGVRGDCLRWDVGVCLLRGVWREISGLIKCGLL